MFCLGLHAYMHDSSACLIHDNQIVAFAEEERFSRVKHSGAFPEYSINFCLEKAGIDVNEIQHVGFSWRPVRHLICRAIDLSKYLPRMFLQVNPERPSIFFNMLKVEKRFRRKYGFRNKFHFLDHQMCHAASSYYTSSFDHSAIIILEANSEKETTLFGMGNGGDIRKMHTIKYPNSVGLLYLCVTEYLGFKENRDEGKVMGLAPYGQPLFYDEFKKIIKVTQGGRLWLDMSYFDVHLEKKTYVTHKFIQRYGPRRKPESLIEKRHMDIASSLQKAMEEICLCLVDHLYSITDTPNLCLAGGVALNSVMNGKLQELSKFDNIYIPPAPNDAGASIGAALLLGSVHNKNRDVFVKNFTPYLGPDFSDEYIEHILKSRGLNYTKLNHIARETAKVLAKRCIVGWFQGRMEAGPRALGNRSILVDPRNPKMKDILNQKVKHREGFRPFAPICLIEYAHRYFASNGLGEPFMLKVFKVLPDKKYKIPAVTHVDGTARLQTVKKTDNPLVWELIYNFYTMTDCPVLLNTSFNVRGEPIVCTPEDAVDCFLKTDIDVLSIGKYMVEKQRVGNQER